MRSRGAHLAAAVAALVLFAPVAAGAQLSSQHVERLRLVYFDGTQTYLVPHTIRTFLNSLAFQRRLLGYDPKEDITVLLADFEDSGNAGASVVPRNTVMVQISPLSFAFETLAANERMNTIMNHELVHIATMDQASAGDRFFRGLFRGKVNPIAEQPETILYLYLTAPRVAAPRWFHEGIAVFLDTWMAGGIGRAQSGYDEMVFRSMVKDGSHFYDPLGLVSEGTKVDFQLQINSYLYGARFMAWLASTYTPERLVEWVQRRDGSRGHYARNFRHVFGRSIEDAWQSWILSERAFQRKNLEAIRQYPVTPYRDVSPRALGSVSRAYYEPRDGRIYAAFNYPGTVAHVGAIDVETGRVEKIVDIKGPVIYTVTSIAYDPQARRIFYTTDNDAHRDLVSVDPATRRVEHLMKDARIGDLAFSQADGVLWGIRHLNGICSLVRIPAPYREWTRVFSWPFGTVVYDLDVSPDGRRVSASFGEITGKQDVRVMDVDQLLGGSDTAAARFDFGPSVPSGFVFSPDGKYLYGSTYYTGVSNIFRYEFATGKVEAVSNTDTGFFRPLPIPANNDLFVFRYSGEGFVPARIEARPLEDVSAIEFFGERLVERYQVLKEWNAGSPADVPVDEGALKPGVYRLAGGLKRESVYPVVQGYKNSAAAGARINFSDPLQLNRLHFVASYSPNGDLGAGERVHLAAEYQRYDWRLNAALNGADFYDLFGPTKTGRKGYRVGAAYHRSLLYDAPRRIELDAGARISGNIDRLPAYQNVPVDVDTLFSADVTVKGTYVRSSLGSVDDEKGRRWSVSAAADCATGTCYPRFHGTADAGVPIITGHSSLWLRNAAGLSPGDPASPFANFFFGGFGNNWVDRGDEKRYRQFYSFPGARLNEIDGRNFVRSTLEWNLPPIRFRRLGTPGFYVTWARPAVFVSGLATNLDAPDRRHRAASAGAQLDFRLTALSTLDMTFSIGAASAWRNGAPARGEFMVSLKVLR